MAGRLVRRHFRALRAPASRSLTRAPRPAVFSARRRASARHEHLEQAAVRTPLPRHAPAHRGGSTGTRRRPRITGAVPRGRKSTAAEPRGRLHVPHQRHPGIAGNAALQSPVPVPRAPPREGEEVPIPTTTVNTGGHRPISGGSKGHARAPECRRSKQSRRASAPFFGSYFRGAASFGMR